MYTYIHLTLHQVTLIYQVWVCTSCIFTRRVTEDECAGITESVPALRCLITPRGGSSNPVTVCTRRGLRWLRAKAGSYLFTSAQPRSTMPPLAEGMSCVGTRCVSNAALNPHLTAECQPAAAIALVRSLFLFLKMPSTCTAASQRWCEVKWHPTCYFFFQSIFFQFFSFLEIPWLGYVFHLTICAGAICHFLCFWPWHPKWTNKIKLRHRGSDFMRNESIVQTKNWSFFVGSFFHLKQRNKNNGCCHCDWSLALVKNHNSSRCCTVCLADP